MADNLVNRALLAEHGEFRAYYHVERGELVFEVLREADGRACLLRLPYRERAAVAHLLRQTAPRLADPVDPGFDEEGLAVLRRALLPPNDRLAAVALASDAERAFAVWREERLRTGWSWTIDVVVVPFELGPRLCELIIEALERVDQPQQNLRQA